MNPLTLGILLTVYAVIVWLMVMMIWQRGYREWKSNRTERLREVPAKVLDRRSEQASGRFYLTLEYGGRQGDFEVLEAIYASARVGQLGILTLRGEKFEDYEPRPEGEGWTDIYDRMVKK